MHQTIAYSDLFDSITEVEKKFAPKRLYYRGDINLLTEGRRVSVVGSRDVSEVGVRRTAFITETLVRADIVVVSGLARGVDSVAHQTAIAHGGRTIAVLGTQLDIAYPKENAGLLETIMRDHLAVSQFPPGYPTLKANFPTRNRTMALISDATIIVEAGEKSGTRHQGWETLRLGRLLYILQNVAEDPTLTWPREMIKYGARVLDRDNLKELIEEIPYLSSKKDLAF